MLIKYSENDQKTYFKKNNLHISLLNYIAIKELCE